MIFKKISILLAVVVVLFLPQNQCFAAAGHDCKLESSQGFLGYLLRSFSKSLHGEDLVGEERSQDLVQIIQEAKLNFSQVAEKRDKEAVAASNEAIVFDIDGTLLDDSTESSKRDDGFKFYNPIAEVKDLYDFVQSKGFIVFLVTARKEFNFAKALKELKNARDFTVAELKAAGIQGFQELIMWDEKEYPKYKDFKFAARQQITDNGFTIIGNVGDQATDFVGGLNGLKVRIPCRD